MKNLVELYCDVDNFCKIFIPQWQKQLIEDGSRKRCRESRTWEVQAAYITVKNLQVIVEFEQHDEILSKPLSSIGSAIAKHENLASYRK